MNTVLWWVQGFLKVQPESNIVSAITNPFYTWAEGPGGNLKRSCRQDFLRRQDFQPQGPCHRACTRDPPRSPSPLTRTRSTHARSDGDGSLCVWLAGAFCSCCSLLSRPSSALSSGLCQLLIFSYDLFVLLSFGLKKMLSPLSSIDHFIFGLCFYVRWKLPS